MKQQQMRAWMHFVAGYAVETRIKQPYGKQESPAKTIPPSGEAATQAIFFFLGGD